MLPAKAGEAVEICVGGGQRAPILNGDRSVLSVRNELSGCRGSTAQLLEDGEMLRPGTYDAGLWPPHQLADELEDFVER